MIPVTPDDGAQASSTRVPRHRLIAEIEQRLPAVAPEPPHPFAPALGHEPDSSTPLQLDRQLMTIVEKYGSVVDEAALLEVFLRHPDAVLRSAVAAARETGGP